jgi:putative PIN family toxin of toxin-antitoxin system
MRVVLDTNVFVSAVLKTNSLPFLVVRSIDRHGGLLKSADTERELLAVLARPRIAAVTSPEFRGDLMKMLAGAELVPIVEHIRASRDPADDKFLELAVNGRADVIVTGDADLLTLNPFRGIPIVGPATYVQAARLSS